MKQYCRYCAFLFDGDFYVCSAGVVPCSKTTSQIRHTNTCKDYVDCGVDIFTGELRKITRMRKQPIDNGSVQLSLLDGGSK